MQGEKGLKGLQNDGMQAVYTQTSPAECYNKGFSPGFYYLSEKALKSHFLPLFAFKGTTWNYHIVFEWKDTKAPIKKRKHVS